MCENPVGPLLCRLYLLVYSKLSVKKGNHIAEGHKFEDETSEQIYHLALELGLEPNPPRMTLQLPTLSGNLHQFDASFRYGKNVYVIECKNTRLAAKDYIYYFNAKILDYVLASKERSEELTLRGIFLSTVPVAKSALRYSFAYGIRVVDPISPPIEYMIQTILDDEGLKSALGTLLDQVNEITPKGNSLNLQKPSQLFKEYQFLCARWRDSCKNV